MSSHGRDYPATGAWRAGEAVGTRKFFSLPTDVWGPYLRVDATPGEVRRAMLGVFSSGSLRLKRRLMSYPGELARAIGAR